MFLESVDRNGEIGFKTNVTVSLGKLGTRERVKNITPPWVTMLSYASVSHKNVKVMSARFLGCIIFTAAQERYEYAINLVPVLTAFESVFNIKGSHYHVIFDQRIRVCGRLHSTSAI